MTKFSEKNVMEIESDHLIYGSQFKRIIVKILLIISLIAASGLAILFYYQTRSLAISDAEKKINTFLLQQKSIHDYLANYQKPEIYRLKEEKKLYNEYFSPKLLSGSFIAREIHEYYNNYRRNNNMSEFYYKMAAINPRNKINTANEFEKKLIEDFKNGRQKKFSKIIKENGKEYLYCAIPFLPNQHNCMRCHGSPEVAPKELIEIYGDKDGFYEKVGDIRAITSIRVSLDSELAEASKRFTIMAVCTLLVLILLFVIMGTRIVAYFTKHTEALIQKRFESETLFRGTFEQSAMGIAHIDLDGKFLRVNYKYCEITGYENDEILDLLLSDIIHPGYLDTDKELSEKLFREEISTYSVERLYVQKNQEYIWINETISLTRDKNGEPHFIISVIEDISKRKQLNDALEKLRIQAELKKSSILLKNVIKQAPFGIHILEGKYNAPVCIFENDESIRILDCILTESKEEKNVDYYNSINCKFMETDSKKELPIEKRPYYRAFKGEIIKNFEVLLIRNDGKKINVEISSSPIYDEDYGFITAIILIFKDITKNKRIQKQFIQSRKMDAIGQLASGIAHDFNNILSPLLGYTEMLKEDVNEDSPLQGSIDAIFQSALRAKDLVQQILSYSRQSSHEIKPISLKPIIKDSLKLLRASIPVTIEIKSDLAEDSGLVKADPTQIHQILMNLVTNAYHAMEKTGGKIEVSLKQVYVERDQSNYLSLVPGNYSCLTVSDTGIGIKSEIIEKIFDPYFTTKSNNKGTGIGLSIVLGIVTSCRGNISIYSEPGIGTKIDVYIPVIDTFTEKSSKVKSRPKIKGGNEQILLVDDEKAIVTMEKKMLERMGYKVTIETDSLKALDSFVDNPHMFDLVITDMTMPGMTGKELAMEMKKIRPEIPIIICTGFSHQINSQNCQELGLQGYILKPVQKRELNDLIRIILDSDT